MQADCIFLLYIYVCIFFFFFSQKLKFVNSLNKYINITRHLLHIIIFYLRIFKLFLKLLFIYVNTLVFIQNVTQHNICHVYYTVIFHYIPFTEYSNFIKDISIEICNFKSEIRLVIYLKIAVKSIVIHNTMIIRIRKKSVYLNIV